MKKGIVRYLAIMLMVASVFSATSWVYASSNSIGVLEKEFNDRYQDVSYKEIHKSANLALSYNVNEKSNVEIGYDFIPLETLDGERYAFLIPIIDGGQLTGYMVMGAIDNNYLMLELSVFQPDFTKYIIGASQKSALVYMFPSVFITNTGKEYFLISEDLKQIDITNSLPAPSTRVLDFLRNLPEPDHLPQSIPESVGLANWEEFVPIFHEDNPPVYGGWQDWLGPNEYHGYGYVSQFQADRSCGVTAAANGAYHMSVYKAGMGNLYNRPNLSREEFTGHYV